MLNLAFDHLYVFSSYSTPPLLTLLLTHSSFCLQSKSNGSAWLNLLEPLKLDSSMISQPSSNVFMNLMQHSFACLNPLQRSLSWPMALGWRQYFVDKHYLYFPTSRDASVVQWTNGNRCIDGRSNIYDHGVVTLLCTFIPLSSSMQAETLSPQFIFSWIRNLLGLDLAGLSLFSQ